MRNRRRLTGNQSSYAAARCHPCDAPLASRSVEAEHVIGDALLATRLIYSGETPHRLRFPGQLLSGGAADTGDALLATRLNM